MCTAILTLTFDRAFTDEVPNTVFRLFGRPDRIPAVVADFAAREGISQLYIFYADGVDPLVGSTAGDVGRQLAQRGIRVRASTTPRGPTSAVTRCSCPVDGARQN